MHTLRRYIVVFLLFLPLLLSAGARITDFQLTRSGNTAIIKWATEQEVNVDCFILQRSVDQMTWTAIHDQKSSAQNSSVKQNYEYRDNSLFKSESSSTFSYRLIIKENDGTETLYPKVLSTHGSSGIKHTWGSIKAMFR